MNFFPEINHELISPLKSLSDHEILAKWQDEPDKYRYLVTIFLRHHNLDNLGEYKIKHQKLIDNFLINIWYLIFDELSKKNFTDNDQLENIIQSSIDNFLSQSIVTPIPRTKGDDLSSEDLRYLPLNYFLAKACNQLYPLERILIVTKDKYQWSEDKIIRYLLQQKQTITRLELKAYYTQAHSRLINALPTDIITIYLN